MIFLVLILSDDDEELLRSIYKTENVKMYNVAFKILTKPEDAEEAVQEAFLRMVNKIERIKDLPCQERVPFCVVIVKNISKNMLRSRKAHIYISDAEHMAADTYSDPQQEFFANVDSAYLVKTINSLTQQDKDIILMKWGKAMRYKEIGTVLGISEDAATKRGQRALKTLRELYMKGLSDG